jgi:hypothetical protein
MTSKEKVAGHKIGPGFAVYAATSMPCRPHRVRSACAFAISQPEDVGVNEIMFRPTHRNGDFMRSEMPQERPSVA